VLDSGDGEEYLGFMERESLVKNCLDKGGRFLIRLDMGEEGTNSL
jgi:hypothetical protein